MAPRDGAPFLYPRPSNLTRARLRVGLRWSDTHGPQQTWPVLYGYGTAMVRRKGGILRTCHLSRSGAFQIRKRTNGNCDEWRSHRIGGSIRNAPGGAKNNPALVGRGALESLGGKSISRAINCIFGNWELLWICEPTLRAIMPRMRRTASRRCPVAPYWIGLDAWCPGAP